MRSWAPVAALACLAACSDGTPPPDAPPPAPAPTRTEPRPRAAPPESADAAPGVVAIDGSPWTPAPEDVAFALRLGASGDSDGREAAFNEWDGLDAARKVAVVRAGLRVADPDVARTAACLAEHEWLDLAEQRRAANLWIDAALDPGFTLPGGDRIGIDDLYEVGGSPEMTRLLQRISEERPDHDLVRYFGGSPHKLLGPEHLPLLARIAQGADGDTATEAWDLACVALTWTDADPDAVMEVARARLAALDATLDAPPPSKDPVAAAAAVLAVTPSLASEKDEGGRTRFWAWRMLARTPGGAVPGRAAALRAAAVAVPVDGAPWGDQIARLAAGLDTDEALAILRARDEEAAGPPSPFVLAALARHGDAEARRALFATVATADSEAVAAALWAFPGDALTAISATLLGDDDEAASAMLGAVHEADLLTPPSMWDRASFAGVARAAAASKLPAERLAELALRLPVPRSAALGRAALDRADGAFWDDPDGDVPAFLEAVDADGFRRHLRAWWAGGGDDWVAGGTLLRLGDPASGARFVTWLRTLTPADRDERFLIALARSDGPEVRAFLSEVARGGTAWVPWTEGDAVAALAVCHGLPEDAASSLRDGLAVDGVPHDLVVRAREAVEAGHPTDAVDAVLAAWPDREFHDVHLTGDRPAVREYLAVVRKRRENGLYAWATAELALLGDAAARRETDAAIAEHRYRWTQSLTWRQFALGDPVAAAPRWIDALATNCCLACDVSEFLDRAFGWEAEYAAGSLVLPVDEARRWWARAGGRFVWSRIAGHLVPAPSNE